MSDKSWRWIQTLCLLVIAVAIVPLALRAIALNERDEQLDDMISQHRARATAALGTANFKGAEIALRSAMALAPHDVTLQREAMDARIRRAAAFPHTIDVATLDSLEYAVDVSSGEGETAEHLVVRGYVAERREDEDRARRFFERALKRDDAYLYAHLALGALNRKQGLGRKALESFQAAVKVAPESVSALNNLGVQWVDLGGSQEAIKILNRALELEATVTTRLNLASAYKQAKQWTEASEQLKRAAAQNPGLALTWRLWAEVLVKLEDHEQAVEAYRRSLVLAPDDTTTMRYAVLLQRLSRHEATVEALMPLYRARPEAFEVAYRLGLSLEALGRADEAATAYYRYVTLAADEPAHRELVAKVRAKLVPRGATEGTVGR